MTETTSIDPSVVNGADLLDRVQATISRYLIMPSPEAMIGTVLWIAATHAVPYWAHAPRLVIRAPERRCGKSRLLDIVEALSHHPLMTVNASPSAVYRSVGMNPDDPPTLLMDEADTIFGPKAGDNEDLRGLLNAGHQRNRPALRYDAGTRSVEKIETYAMAALAGIGAMPDTIEDRAVVIRMRRRAPGETVRPYRAKRDGPPLAELRDTLHDWVNAHGQALGDAAPDMPVEDRVADTWEPLIVIADAAGPPWCDLARHAALTLSAEHDEAGEEGTGVRLLTDIRAVFDAADAEALPTNDLLARLKADPESPWSTHGYGGLAANSLSTLLREFGIGSRTIRFPTGQAKGYDRAAFADSWSRYIRPLHGTDPGPATESDPPRLFLAR